TYREALLIPPDTQARPTVASRGALMDPNFTVLLDEWVDPYGRRVQPSPKLLGRVLAVADIDTLLPEPLHLLLEELECFHSTPAAERTLAFKEQLFGRLRRLATSSNCPVSDYIA